MINTNNYTAISFTCINTRIENVSNNIANILNMSSMNKCKVEMNSVKEINIIPTLEYNPKNLNIVLWEPKLKPGTTVFTSNLIDGSDSLISILSNKYDEETYKVFFTIGEEEKYPAYIFSYKRKDFERSIRAAFENKWVFFQRGIPLLSENVDVYKKRKIKDKINKKIITSILSKEGWDIENELFWKSNSGSITISLKYRD